MKTKELSLFKLLCSLSFLTLAAIAQSTEMPKIVLTIDETDEITYASKAQMHIEQNGHALEDRFLAHHLVQIARDSLRSGRGLDIPELMKEANQFKAEASQMIHTATGELKVNDMKVAADQFYSIFDHLPLLGDYFSGFRAANGLVSEIYGASIEANNQLKAQFQSAQRVQSADQISDEVFRDLHTLGRSVPQMDILVDGVFSHDFGDASVHDSAKKLRTNDMALDSNMLFRENIGEDGRLIVNLDEAKLAFKTYSRQISSEINQMASEVRELRTQFQSNALSEQQLKETQKKTSIERAQEEERLELARSGMVLYCNLISKFDPKNGHILVAATRAGFDIANSLSRYKQNIALSLSATTPSISGSAFSSVKLTGDLVQIGLSLVTSLFSSGPTPDQLILEQLGIVKGMIKELADVMQADFQQIDGKLNFVLGKLDEQLEKLNQIEFGSKTMAHELTEIQRALLVQQTQLGTLESEVDNALTRSFFNELDTQNQKQCIEADYYTSASFMPYADYRKCVETFSTFASRPAQDVGASTSVNGVSIGKRIGSLAKEAAHRNNFAMIPTQADHLVDPTAWSVGSTAYLKLLNARPEFSRLTSTRALQEMLTAGNQLLQSLQGITVISNGRGKFISNAPFLLGLVDSYIKDVGHLEQTIQTLENQYQDNPKEGTHSYPLWPTNENTVALNLGKKLPRCGSESSKAPLIYPAGISDLIPTEAKALQQITGKGLDICYDLKPILTQSEGSRTMCFLADCIPAQNGKLSITLNASFDGKRIFSRHSESVEIPAGNRGESEGSLLEGLAKPLMDAEPITFQIGTNCHLNFQTWNELASRHERPTPDCLYGKYLQESMIQPLMSPSAEQVSDTERQHTLAYLRSKLDDSLSKHRRTFQNTLIDKLKRADDIQQSLKNLSESAKLVSDYIELGLPKSLTASDRLRSSVFGSQKLMSGDDVTRMIESDLSGEEIHRVSEELTTRAVTLRNILADLLKEPVIETQPMIEDIMLQLKSAFEAQTKALPKVRMEDAWNDLRTAVTHL